MFSLGAVLMLVAVLSDVAIYGMPTEPEMVFCFYAAFVLCAAVVLIEFLVNLKKEVNYG